MRDTTSTPLVERPGRSRLGAANRRIDHDHVLPPEPPGNGSASTPSGGEVQQPPPLWRRIRPGRLAMIVAGAVLLALLVRGWLPEPVQVETATVERRPLVVTVREDARTRVRDRYVVAAPVAGTLLRPTLEAGDSVQRGQVVARLLPLAAPMLDRRSRAEATARVQMAQALLEQARTAATAAAAAHAQAVREAERVRALGMAGGASAQAVEQAELAERTHREELASAQFAVEAARHQLATQRAVLERGGESGGDPIALTAPVDGVVLRLERESEGPIQAGAPVLSIGNPNALEVVVDLLTADAAAVARGAPVTIDRWGGEGTLAGRVRRVEPSAFTKVSALGVEEQRVNVIVDLDVPPARGALLGDEFRVEAEIEIWRTPETLTAPASALFRSGDAWAVYRVDEGRARLTPVEIGRRTDVLVQVLGGLDAGDQVVIYPGDAVEDDARVAVPAGS